MTGYPLGSGTSGGTNAVTELSFNGVQNLLYIGGTFTAAGGITFPDSLTLWNGSGFVLPDVDLPASSQVNAIIFGVDGTLYLGFNQRGTARIYSMFNTTTNRALYFSLIINAGEVVTLVLQPDALSFTSNVQGDIANTVLPGSNTVDFFLQPGPNTIAFLSASKHGDRDDQLAHRVYIARRYSLSKEAWRLRGHCYRKVKRPSSESSWDAAMSYFCSHPCAMTKLHTNARPPCYTLLLWHPQ